MVWAVTKILLGRQAEVEESFFALASSSSSRMPWSERLGQDGRRISNGVTALA